MASFGISYGQPSNTGFWGVTNSQANFCEEDYIVTHYVAELLNSLTNLTYMYYAVYGIRKNAGREDAFLRNLPYWGIMSVGVGSMIFHATLKYYTQWCDGLSMLIAVGSVFHRVYTFDKSSRTTITVGVALTTFLTIFSIWHCWTDELVMHDAIFGVLIFFVGLKTRQIIKDRVKNPAVRKEVVKMTNWGSVTFVGGFGIWNLDRIFCGFLNGAKHQIGMPLSFLLELHGWWHVFTGIGAYFFIALVEYLTSDEAGEPLGGRFAWPVGLVVDGKAGVEEQTHENGKANTNGHSKQPNGQKSS